MRTGLYKVSFKTPIGSGAGVVVLENGMIRGGDSMMFYRGTYTEGGGTFTADVVAGKHSTVPGMGTVFGRDSVSISLKGKNTDINATMIGTAKEAPGVTLEATLALLA